MLKNAHNGSQVAQAASRIVPRVLCDALERMALKAPQQPADVRRGVKEAFAPRRAELSAERNIDGLLREATGESGSTALAAIFLPGCAYIANLGDSRAVLVGKNGAAQRLSFDQKPSDDEERAKIEGRGGRVRRRSTTA